MGIKKGKMVYVTDRGQEIEVEQMEYSHLLNAHAHHTKQLETMNKLGDLYEVKSDLFWVKKKDLDGTLAALEREIVSRVEDNAADLENHRYGY